VVLVELQEVVGGGDQPPVLTVLTDTLASMTKHSCRAFADVALSRGTCS
jgi:hypothetical protein